MKKVFIDEKGSVSIVDAPDNAIVRIDPPDGLQVYEKDVTDEEFDLYQQMAIEEKKLSGSEVAKIKAEHKERERAKSSNQ